MAKNLKLLAITLLLLFVVAEVVLRTVFHVVPGQQYNTRYFTPVPEGQLVVKHGFDADSAGIQKVEDLATDVINQRIQHFVETGEYVAVADTESDNVYSLAGYSAQFTLPDFENDLKTYTQAKGFPATDLDLAIQHYLTHPVNVHGFRSIAFSSYQSGKKKVLLLGDSFTWGHSATNMYSSFADNLLAKGYAVYNTGITCTDPVQYQLVAEKYIPLLKPDFVIMNVYLGNDVHYYNREVKPFVPTMIPTNAGNLTNDFNGITLSNADSIYAVISDGLAIPTNESWVNKFCSFTAIGTLTWRVAAKFNLVNRQSNKFGSLWSRSSSLALPKPDVNQRTRNIQRICTDNGATLVVSVIPYLNNLTILTGPETFEGFMDSLPYFVTNIAKSGYELQPDGHFNNEGHKAYAGFLAHLMDSISQTHHP